MERIKNYTSIIYCLSLWRHNTATKAYLESSMHALLHNDAKISDRYWLISVLSEGNKPFSIYSVYWNSLETYLFVDRHASHVHNRLILLDKVQHILITYWVFYSSLSLHTLNADQVIVPYQWSKGPALVDQRHVECIHVIIAIIAFTDIK